MAVIGLILWLTLSVSETIAYVDTECAGLPITSFGASSNIATILDSNYSLTEQEYTTRNTPPEYSDQTPGFLASSVDPISRNIYVIFYFRIVLGNVVNFLGLLNPLTSEITITTPHNPISISITSITFDCNGILYGITSDTTDIYIINKITSNIQLFESGVNKYKCDPSNLNTHCNEVLSFNYNNGLFYRISSAINQQGQLYIRENNGIETVYNINDTNEFCQTDSIHAFEFIGKHHFLISCGGRNEGIYLLDTQNINYQMPTVININIVDIPVACGIIVSDLSYNICIPETDCTHIKPSKNDHDNKENFVNPINDNMGLVIGLSVVMCCILCCCTIVLMIGVKIQRMKNDQHRPPCLVMTRSRQDAIGFNATHECTLSNRIRPSVDLITRVTEPLENEEDKEPVDLMSCANMNFGKYYTNDHDEFDFN